MIDPGPQFDHTLEHFFDDARESPEKGLSRECVSMEVRAISTEKRLQSLTCNDVG